MTPRQEEVFFEVHSGLEREGPGDALSTRRAFASIKELPRHPKILDLGCGPGAQTLVLAELCDGEITALDNHRPFLEQLTRRIGEKDLAGRVFPTLADMHRLPFEPGRFDLIWAEGSIFIIGFERGLAEWRALLKPHGHIALTQVSWLKNQVPAEVAEFWQNAYPDIRTIEENCAAVRRAGYELLETFVLPESAWWEEYYGPIEEKLGRLEAKYSGDAEALEILEAERTEIGMFRKYADCYGYVFFVARRLI